MTLREYALTMKRNYWTARVMYAQLLEAIVYLYEHTIAHRDMKSDNILLDFDSDGKFGNIAFIHSTRSEIFSVNFLWLVLRKIFVLPCWWYFNNGLWFFEMQPIFVSFVFFFVRFQMIILLFRSDDVPHLVLGDFGCALANGSWRVEYPDDSVDLGGNLALRAPEVSFGLCRFVCITNL